MGDGSASGTGGTVGSLPGLGRVCVCAPLARDGACEASARMPDPAETPLQGTPGGRLDSGGAGSSGGAWTGQDGGPTGIGATGSS